MHCAERLKRSDNKRTVGLERDKEGNREKRELRTDASFMKTCRCNAHDDMMKCNKQIKHTTITKNMDGIWSIGLGALHSGTDVRLR